MLTPADIEQKTFSTALRGYDLDEVDDFLDQVMATIRDLQEELAEARSSAARSPEPVADESAVGRALIAAQSAADQILASARDDADRALVDAKEEADRLVSEARVQADEFIAERDVKKAEAEAEMKTLSDHVSKIRTQLALLATAVADKLDEMDALIAGEAAAESGQASGPESWDEDAEPTVSGEMAEADEENGSGSESSLFDEDEHEDEGMGEHAGEEGEWQRPEEVDDEDDGEDDGEDDEEQDSLP